MSIYAYKTVTTEGPNGSTIHPILIDGADYTLLASIEGWDYIHVPDGSEIPPQPLEIEWQWVNPEPELRALIKSNSKACRLIDEQMQKMIREKYSLEDEQYFARIGVGAALGAYQFEEGEQEELLAFGEYVEGIRQWGRAERAKLGLA